MIMKQHIKVKKKRIKGCDCGDAVEYVDEWISYEVDDPWVKKKQ